MLKANTKLTPRGNSQAVTIPKDVMDAAGLRLGDALVLTARDDGVIEVRRAEPDEAAMDAAFEWSLGRYDSTYRDLAK